jgi:sterol desaturase/sphingolipid hydroxylase (fatty acid hydroxylase superfamily)
VAIVGAAIPIFFILIVLELILARWRRRRVHALNDSVTDFGCGVLAQIVGIFVGLLSVAMYAFVAARGSLQRLAEVPPWPETVAGWIAAFVLVDLGQYVTHRMCHRCQVLWACHVVHHSSEELNYVVATRVSSVQSVFNTVFFLPLAVIGLPWQMAVTCYGLNQMHQFWLHTRLVGRLGWLETFLVTPSHHRVHHGRDAKYVDRNYGGVLIIWDRLFGSFQREEEEPHFGLTRPLRSWNAVWANVQGFGDVVRKWRASRGWRERSLSVFGPPEWEPPDALQPIVGPQVQPGAPDGPLETPAALRWYAVAQLSLVLPATLIVLRHRSDFPLVELLGFGFVVTLTLGNIGALLDGARWVWASELARHAALAGAGAGLLISGWTSPWLAVPVLGWSLVSYAWLESARPARRAARFSGAQSYPSRR